MAEDYSAGSTYWQRIRHFARLLAPSYEDTFFEFKPYAKKGSREFMVEGWDFMFDPDFLELQVAYGLVHMTDHYFREHKDRRERRIGQIWSDACCIESHLSWSKLMKREHIQRMLEKQAEKQWGPAWRRLVNASELLDKLWIPPGMDLHTQLGIKDPDIAEHIYDKIKDKYEVQNMTAIAIIGMPQAGEGQGEGGEGKDAKVKKEKGKEGEGEGKEESSKNEMPKRLSGNSCRFDVSAFDQDIAKFEELLDKAVQAAAGLEPGDEEGAMVRAFKVDKPEYVNWKHLAKMALNTVGNADFTYSPWPRDFTNYGGGMMMAERRGKPEVAFAVDLSGSIDPEMLNQIIRIVKGVVMENYEVHIAGGDTHLTYPEKGQRGTWAELTKLAQKNHESRSGMKGGGGTDMAKLAWETYLKFNMPEHLILVTDAETPWPTKQTPVTVGNRQYQAMPPDSIIFVVSHRLEHIMGTIPHEIKVRCVGVPADKERKGMEL